ncbi:MAG: hypothetical protein DI603_00890 [Roseateles depolymerans]|uniref:Ice-binding protein C-terminal domain-containing protein n=1 Tax=Roseateles depolymerans TaxID=76731 RepID=A0A2W5E636_9BURK|nr:MAG: hypothetical protein DI603_00890 [Roseateles depolymerans]
MRFRFLSLALAAGLALGTSGARADAITETAYASLGGSAISFSELVVGAPDGVLIEGLLGSGGVLFGERFAGQELAVAKAPRPGAVAQDWFDDLSFGTPSAGLTLLAGATGANLGAYDYGDADGIALAGIGPQNPDGSDPFGLGAISARFDAPVSALGLQLRESGGGAITLSLYRLDGSLIQAMDLSGRSDGFYAFTRSDGSADIAGFTLTNRDSYYGIAIDNLLLSPVPEPASALLAVLGLALLGGLRRRRDQALD